jgi:hypothetical protein
MVFKMSNFWICHRAMARSYRDSAAVAGFSSAPRAAATGASASSYHLYSSFGLMVSARAARLGRATLAR